MNLLKAFDFVGAMRPGWRTAKGTWRNPAKINRGHVLRILGADKNVAKITKADLAAMRATLLREGRANGGVNRIMGLLNTLLSELVDNEIIAKHPKLKKLDESGNARQEYYTRENIDDLVRIARDDLHSNELADSILFALYTGCRRGNLLNLEVRDLNFTDDTILFRDTKQGPEYTIDINPKIRSMLMVRCEGEDQEAKVFNFQSGDCLYREFIKARDKAGLSKKYIFHSLRHTTGTWLAESDVPIQTIAKILGHSTLEMSMRYTKISDKARKSAIDKL